MSRHREAFEEFAEKAQNELGESLEKLVLFGSVARGEETEESDIDVFAVVSSRDDRQRLHELAFESEVEHDVVISLIVRDLESFRERQGTSFVREIIDQGEVRV